MIKPNYDPSLFYHWTNIPIRFRDLDPLNHVNNSVYNTFFEEARIDFINHVPELKASFESGHSFVLVRLRLDYVKPIRMNEIILVGTSISEFGNSSLSGFQAIYAKDNKELKAVAKTTGVLFNQKKSKPERLPEILNPEQYLIKIEGYGQK